MPQMKNKNYRVHFLLSVVAVSKGHISLHWEAGGFHSGRYCVVNIPREPMKSKLLNQVYRMGRGLEFALR